MWGRAIHLTLVHLQESVVSRPTRAPHVHRARLPWPHSRVTGLGYQEPVRLHYGVLDAAGLGTDAAQAAGVPGEPALPAITQQELSLLPLAGNPVAPFDLPRLQRDVAAAAAAHGFEPPCSGAPGPPLPLLWKALTNPAVTLEVSGLGSAVWHRPRIFRPTRQFRALAQSFAWGYYAAVTRKQLRTGRFLTASAFPLPKADRGTARVIVWPGELNDRRPYIYSGLQPLLQLFALLRKYPYARSYMTQSVRSTSSSSP